MIYAVAFGKGGTGKTSTATALSNYAKMHGHHVLAVDCDSSANMTFALGGDPSAPGLFDVLDEDQPNIHTADVIQHTEQCDILPAGINLATAEMKFRDRDRRDFMLKNALAEVKMYDTVVIDTHPDLSVLQTNALTAADTVILPMEANTFSIMGLYQMRNIIATIQNSSNPALSVAGILLVKYKARQTLAQDMRKSVQEQADELDCPVFTIREGVAVAQAQAMQQSLFDFAPASHPARDYETVFKKLNI